MKRRRAAAVLLAAVVLATGCGSTASTDGTAGNTADAGASEEAVSQEGAASREESDSNTDGQNDDTEDESQTAGTPGGLGSEDIFSGKGTIEDTVLVDEKDVKVTASNLTYTSDSVTIDLLIENNSSQDLSFIGGSLGYSCNAVNGYTVPGFYINENVTAGNKVNTETSVQIEELEALGITDVAELELGIMVETEDNDEYLTTGPLKIETSSADSYDLSADTYQAALSDGRFEDLTGSTVKYIKTDDFYSADGVKLISAALAEKGSSKYVLLETENTSDDELLRFRVGSFAVNNLVISSSDWDSVTINPSGRAILTLDIDGMLDEEEYEQFGIGEIGEAAFHVDIVNANGNYLAEDDLVSIEFNENNEGNAAADDSGEEIYSAGGIRIISKGTSKDDYDFNLLLMVVNDSDETIYVSDEYDSTSVNGFMADASMYGQEIEPGQAGGLKYQIDMNSLDANNISISDITTVTFQLNIGSGSFYNYIDQPELTIEYEK